MMAPLDQAPHANGQPLTRRLPVGAEVTLGGVHFRGWAPCRRRVEVVFERDAWPAPDLGLPEIALAAEGNGYFSGMARAGAGDLYRFRLDGGDTLYPDPASRFQPHGPHGPSQIIDPSTFRWTDSAWRGTGPEGQVL